MLMMFLLAFTLTSLGIVVAARMKSREGFQMIMQFLLMPLFFLSGALFPLRNLPGWLSFLSKIDPLSYGVDPLRQVVFHSLNLPASVLSRFGVGITFFDVTLSITAELAVLGCLAILFVSWAALAFSKQE